MRQYKLEYQVEDQLTEGTAKPIWYIVITKGQRLVKRTNYAYDIMNRIVGPFSSRERAEKHRKSRIYGYGENSVVFCYSAYYSDLEEVK